MSESRFMLLAGSGNKYDWEEIRPDALLPFYDDKGVRVLSRLCCQDKTVWHRIRTYQQSADGAFLLTTAHLFFDLTLCHENTSGARTNLEMYSQGEGDIS